MCYGDIDYGRDGYYRAWVEEQERLAHERQQAEEEWARQAEEQEQS